MPTSEFFHLSADDLADPVRAAEALNQMLSHIADRLDALQGLRGDAVIRGSLRVEDADGNQLHGFDRGPA